MDPLAGATGPIMTATDTYLLLRAFCDELAQHRRERLARLRLAHSGLAFEQQWLRQVECQEDRCRQPLVDEIVDARRPPGEGFDVGDESTDLRLLVLRGHWRGV